MHVLPGLAAPPVPRAPKTGVYLEPPRLCALSIGIGIGTRVRRVVDVRRRGALGKVREWFALRAGVLRRAVSSLCSFAHLELLRLSTIAAREQNRAMSSQRERLAHQGSWAMQGRLTSPACPSRRARPNPSLERTRNGVAPWPRGALVHDAPHGQGATPLRAAQLKR